MMNQTGRIGVIAKGAHADLLVLDGDPLADLGILQQPDTLRAVMKAGKFVLNRLTHNA